MIYFIDWHQICTCFWLTSLKNSYQELKWPFNDYLGSRSMIWLCHKGPPHLDIIICLNMKVN